MKLSVAACASALVVLLTVGACSVPSKVQTPADTAATSGSTAAAAGAPKGFEDYYTQVLNWKDCGDGYECSTARAPQSWGDAESGDIEIAVKRLPATGKRIGSLLTNPGGPGGSGTQFITEAASSMGDRLKESFDLIGFDPRGVKASSPVVCMDDAGKDAFLSEDVADDAQGRAKAAEEQKAWAQACQANTGDLLGQVDTQSAARDMDMLRAVLGDTTLNYLGYSYGTQLGATYAGLFPKTVGRLVLDGAVDPTLTPDQVTEQQAVGFEKALRAYVENCQAGADCPLRGSVDDGMSQIRTMLDRVFATPIPTNGKRRVTQSLAFKGIAVTLYDDGSWPYLTQALTEVFSEGTGSMLLSLADFYNDRDPDGTFSTNSTEANIAVNCLDARQDADPAAMAAQAERLDKEAPTVGSFFAYGGTLCASWPYPAATRDYDLSAPGAAPIVVIGTTGDPATPYEWSEGLARTLDSAVLMTWKGEGHTAYGRSNDCIADAVEDYLVDGTVPKDGLTC